MAQRDTGWPSIVKEHPACSERIERWQRTRTALVLEVSYVGSETSREATRVTQQQYGGTKHRCVHNPQPGSSEFVAKPFGIKVNSNTHGE